MKRYKYIIGSILLIFMVILIFIPRPAEKIYVLFDKIECNQEIVKNNSERGSFQICQGSKFINFIKNKNKGSKFVDFDEIEKLDITSYKKLLKRFNNDKFNQQKNSFDLLNRNKKIDFNLIIKNDSTKKIEIIPVKQIRIICSLKLIN
ncbi:hypothetical protein [Polaribacter sargassicola]|uniref:hypothetical protein n=1 Tax=Polaribacter sargassicola TaxID=2836891 RepID=UPI001F2351FA|nr:hypothetical protein [Polaribacter sp. DS7-9]MCG1035646.1 hypothetical protein [Polaribacter sp. DS7-9]